MRKLLKRFLALTTSLIIAFSCFMSATAVDLTYGECTVALLQNGDFPKNSGSVQTISVPRYNSNGPSISVYDCLYNGFSTLQTSVNIYDYRVPVSQLSTVFQSVINQNGDLFYIGNSFGYSQSGGYIYAIFPQYSYTADEISAMQVTFDQKVNKILSLTNSGWNDTEKALFVHDYLAARMSYDTDYEIYDAYRFLTENEGVCQAYTLTANYLLGKLGVDSQSILNDSINHTWNVVTIDGNTYHVDITWDDPLGSSYGFVGHDNFLLSDAKIASTGHGTQGGTGWYGLENQTYSCTDAFDNMYWKDVSSEFVFDSGSWYYATNSLIDNKPTATIMKTSNILNAGTKIYSFADFWRPLVGGGYYINPYCGFYVDGYDIYYNNSSQILKHNYATKVTETIYTNQSSDGNFYGLTYTDENLFISVNSAPNSPVTELVYPVFGENYINPKPTSSVEGDFDNDGLVTMVDLMYMARAVANWDGYKLYPCFDLDGSGLPDSSDVNILARYLAN